MPVNASQLPLMRSCRASEDQGRVFCQYLGFVGAAYTAAVLRGTEQMPLHVRQPNLDQARVRQYAHMSAYRDIDSALHQIFKQVRGLLDHTHSRILEKEARQDMIERELSHSHRT